MKITACRVNHMENPVGFRMLNPVFSWKTEAAGTKQKWARIQIASDPGMKKILFDTGERDLSSLAAEVPFESEPRQRYYWTVTVSSETEEAVSQVQFFETGKKEEPWIGKWITCDMKETRHPVFQKQISIQKEIRDARIYFAGLGLFEVSFEPENGGSYRIGEEYLTPYCNDFSSWLQIITLEAEQIRTGGTLSFHGGPGWAMGRFGFAGGGKTDNYASEYRLIAELHITYTDGSEEVIGTDDSWTVKRSEITFSNIYDGEIRDDTLPALPEEPVYYAEHPSGVLTDRMSLPLKIQQEIVPAALLTTPENDQVLDVGFEIAGIFRLRVHEPAGTIIHIQTGEQLIDGCFSRENLRTAKSEYIYTSNGKETVIEPKFTYYGYRYVRVRGIKDLRKEDFTALSMYSDMEMNSTVSSDNELLNRFAENVRRGEKCNFVDVPTDCPQRDERMGWTGDTQVFSSTACYLSDPYAFYAKYLYDMAEEQKKADGRVPNVIPAFMEKGTSAAWGDAAVIIPDTLYRFYGDPGILQNQYESMKGWVDWIEKTDGDNHAWRQQFHYGDWLALDHPSGAKDAMMGGTDVGFIADIFYGASAAMTAEAAEKLGKKEDAKKYRALSERVFSGVREEYYTASGRCSIHTQTALLLTLKYHLSSDEERIKDELRQMLEYSDFKLKTGFVGTPLFCDVLSEIGCADLAWELLLNEEYPGWLNEVKLGATTVWERWNSLDENGHFSSNGMNSLNHYAYGAVMAWVYRHAAGIREKEPGFQKAVIAPEVTSRLRYLDVSFDSAAGTYKVFWDTGTKGRLTLRITVPFNAEAEVRLPLIKAENLKNDPSLRNNPLLQDVRNGICHVKAGTYEISYDTDQSCVKTYGIDSELRDITGNKAIMNAMPDLSILRSVPDALRTMKLKDLVYVFPDQVTEASLAQLDAFLKQF